MLPGCDGHDFDARMAGKNRTEFLARIPVRADDGHLCHGSGAYASTLFFKRGNVQNPLIFPGCSPVRLFGRALWFRTRPSVKRPAEALLIVVRDIGPARFEPAAS